MNQTGQKKGIKLKQPIGVILNAYPDSIGNNLGDMTTMLQMPEFQNVFSLFYILPTFFNSDLDRGFSIIDYNTNEEFVSKDDMKALERLGISLKLDIVLNHLSVASPQFKDLIKNGEKSKYKDFFIDWNEFWIGNGDLTEGGNVVPNTEHLEKLFMRKPGLPILKVIFPDGKEKFYWNTFYQKVYNQKLVSEDLKSISGLNNDDALEICEIINSSLDSKDFELLDFGRFTPLKDEIFQIINQNQRYLGQMDVNAKSPLVWKFYKEVLVKVKSYGCKILRLDAFAYLHKEVGAVNFFNKPGTWDYLERINQIAKTNDLQLLPEIHAEYGMNLHDEVAQKGYIIYDFFLPGLLIHAIEKGTNKALIKWAKEIIEKDYKTVNMLGCHDGIPMLDLKGKEVNGVFNQGLLEDDVIEEMIKLILSRKGRVKNLYGADGEKISYYQVNATYFSALGESEQKLLLARAIQLFMPGTPQIWYLDLFAGKNDYVAADKAGTGGHKEINRTNLSIDEIKEGLTRWVVIKQLEMIQLRNVSDAFSGDVVIKNSSEADINITWTNKNEIAMLEGNLKTHLFNIVYSDSGIMKNL